MITPARRGSAPSLHAPAVSAPAPSASAPSAPTEHAPTEHAPTEHAPTEHAPTPSVPAAAAEQLAGPAATFTQFAADAARPLMRTAWLLTGDWYLAEDLVQEALARVYRVWSRPPDSPLAYTRRTLVHVFLSQRRRRSSGERPVAVLPEQAGEGPDVALRRTLVDALLTLSERDRAVLVLRYLADRSVEEVAQDLGRSPGAVRVQASRALARLRTALAGSELDLVRP